MFPLFFHPPTDDFAMVSNTPTDYFQLFPVEKKKAIPFLCQRILVTELLPNFSFKTNILYCSLR